MKYFVLLSVAVLVMTGVQCNLLAKLPIGDAAGIVGGIPGLDVVGSLPGLDLLGAVPGLDVVPGLGGLVKPGASDESPLDLPGLRRRDVANPPITNQAQNNPPPNNPPNKRDVADPDLDDDEDILEIDERDVNDPNENNNNGNGNKSREDKEPGRDRRSLSLIDNLARKLLMFPKQALLIG
ncbi:uncharacterized protein LOC143188090 isoform X2 [Calliopsis andreniformis]|uniref:uncharacterized protein LOC143188090 isoform X2 n=1 Tax=Calliopsis andreniformis TaxID=337506 RepID=UPI003FCC2F9D